MGERPYGRGMSPSTLPRLSAATALAAAIATTATGCGSSSSASGSAPAGGQRSTAPNPNTAEVNPAGDIPDDQAFVRFTPPERGYSVKVPEGWSRTTARGAVTFTDKLNAIRVESTAAKAPLTVTAARRSVVPRLAAAVKGFKPGTVSVVQRNAGSAVRITYLSTAQANPVTGRTGRDAVERYVFFHDGCDLVLTLSGPEKADNVDPWRIVSDSVRWSG